MLRKNHTAGEQGIVSVRTPFVLDLPIDFPPVALQSAQRVKSLVLQSRIARSVFV